MSKEISDVLGRLHGNLIALEGAGAKVSPPGAGAPPTVEQAAAASAAASPPFKAKKEDYDYVKKLAEEIQGLCKNLVDYVDHENKVPPGPEGVLPSPQQAAAEDTHQNKGKK